MRFWEHTFIGTDDFIWSFYWFNCNVCVNIGRSLNFTTIILAQQDVWYVVGLLPFALLFFISALAETNRPRLIYLKQKANWLRDIVLNILRLVCFVFYSGIRKYYTNVNFGDYSVFCGWLPLINLGILETSLWLPLKVSIILFLFIAVRASVPRYRYDQLMYLGWKVFLPLVLGLLLVSLGFLILFGN